jgi:hypothetical protein
VLCESLVDEGSLAWIRLIEVIDASFDGGVKVLGGVEAEWSREESYVR